MGGFVWMLNHGGLPLLPPREALSGVRWSLVTLYTLLFGVVVYLRSARWSPLIRSIADIPSSRVLGISLFGFCAILLAPLRMGELVRPALVAEPGKLSFTQATGSVAVERILDGLVLSLMLLYGLQSSPRRSPLPDHIGELPIPAATIPAASYSALALFFCASALIVVYYWRREQAKRLVHGSLDWLSPRLASWVSSTADHLSDGLRFLPSLRHVGPFVLMTLGYWVSNALSMWLLFVACHIQATFAQSCVVMGVVGIGILLPAGPGFFGSFQLAIYCALVLFFPVEIVVREGAAYVFLLYVTQLLVTLIAGAIGLKLTYDTRPATRHSLSSRPEEAPASLS